jgi:hypothetical protein
MISSSEGLVVQARRQFEALLALVEATKDERIDRVEGKLFGELLNLGLTLLGQYVAQHGTGDAGPTWATPAGTCKRLEDLHPRRYVSIFGEMSINRTVYGTRAKQKIRAVPLDARLGLPDGDFSYLLQSWLQELCLDLDYAGAGSGLAAILRVRPSVRSIEDMTRRMAADVPEFQAQQPLPAAGERAELLVATADHKGVPMVRRDRPATATADEDSERPGVKRAACAGAVYTTERFIRTSEDVINEVRRKERATQRPSPQGKVVWAEMRQEVEGQEVSGREVVMANLCAELDRRDPTQEQAVIVLCDGERALWKTILAMLTRPHVAILDLWHALTYLWLAAKVFHVNKQARETFVTARLRMLLEGEVRGVIKGLKQMGTQHGLTGEKRRTLAKVVGYFENNSAHMRYDVYLREGYPIGSGVIEGACRHVIKDRMERAGMLWTLVGASALLRLRVVHTNNHWGEYQEYRILREQQALYGTDAPHALAA